VGQGEQGQPLVGKVNKAGVGTGDQGNEWMKRAENRAEPNPGKASIWGRARFGGQADFWRIRRIWGSLGAEEPGNSWELGLDKQSKRV